MIATERFTALKARALKLAHTSMTYTAYEDVKGYDLVASTASLILLAGVKPTAEIRELHWAANEPQGIINAAKSSKEETLITFVPPEWKETFLNSGFSEYGILREYWIDRLRDSYAPKIDCEPILFSETEEAAAVSQSCRLLSREFFGETNASLTAWMTGCDPQARAGGARFETVLACRDGKRMIGIVSTAVYEYESAGGPICWVREVAVLPEYQGGGYGRALVESALQYGKEHGAVRAFLMADDCNIAAIALYRKIGFEPSENNVQIDLVYKP